MDPNYWGIPQFRPGPGQNAAAMDPLHMYNELTNSVLDQATAGFGLGTQGKLHSI